MIPCSSIGHIVSRVRRDSSLIKGRNRHLISSGFVLLAVEHWLRKLLVDKQCYTAVLCDWVIDVEGYDGTGPLRAESSQLLECYPSQRTHRRRVNIPNEDFLSQGMASSAQNVPRLTPNSHFKTWWGNLVQLTAAILFLPWGNRPL